MGQNGIEEQLYKIHKNIKGNIDKFSVDRIIAIVINL